MSSVEDHLKKVREERAAKEKARIEKLRELNLKKYSTYDSAPKSSAAASKHCRIPIKDSTRPGTSANSVKSEVIRKTTVHSKPSKIPAISVKSEVLQKTTTTELNKPTKISVAKKNTDIKVVNSGIKRAITAPVLERNALSKEFKNPKTAGQDNTDSNHVRVQKKVLKAFKVDTSIQKALEKLVVSENSEKYTLQAVDVKAKGDAESKTPDNVDVINGEIPKLTGTSRTEISKSRMSFAFPSERKTYPKISRKSFAPRVNPVPFTPNKTRESIQPYTLRQTLTKPMQISKPMMTSIPTPPMQPVITSQTSKVDNTRRQSVFERLYQPKMRATKLCTTSKVDDEVEKMKNDPQYIKELIKNTQVIGLNLNKRHTVFEAQDKPKQVKPMRRSISAAHFKRIGKNEIQHCIHKWSSVEEKLDKISIQAINEDKHVKQDKIISAIKSERKKVQFKTPISYNCHTPKPEELQRRLQNWLKKRGKSLDSYHHLQCFGINHMTERIRPFNMNKSNFAEPETLPETQKIDTEIAKEIQNKENPIQDNVNEREDKFESFEDDNKENEPLMSDSDNDSYTEIMNDRSEDFVPHHDWRKPSSSIMSDCMDLNETRMTQDTSLSGPELHHVDELLLGALNDLTEMLREGFDWEQSASWLRAIREQFPSASDTAAYWECRSALEERRGDLSASLQCWEEAVAKGTERSVAEANLDQILDKFMQLKISPGSGRSRQPDPKMVDVKNVFKSTVIRFAVQQAKLRQSTGTYETPKFTVTPVRRSSRLSARCTEKPDKKTPLRIYASVKLAGSLGHNVTFVPNDKLLHTP